MAKIHAFGQPQGCGKFSCRADERIYRMTLDGCCETIGEADGFGFYAKVDGPILGLAKGGAILNEDGYGFVGVDYFDTPEDLAQEWDNIEAEYREWGEGIEDDDENA